MIMVSIPVYINVERYIPGDDKVRAELTAIIGEARLLWRDGQRLQVHAGEGDEAAWVTVAPGEWTGVCERGCVHVFSDDDIRTEYRRVH